LNHKSEMKKNENSAADESATTGPQQVVQDSNLSFPFQEIEEEILPGVIKWNAEFCHSSGRGTRQWKQKLKNKFVQKTQLDAIEPYRRKKKWRKDMQEAVEETIGEICPNWKINKDEFKLRERILGETKKRSPRQDWLQEKAYAWLKSSHGRETLGCYPGNEIKIAYSIFLKGSGQFCSFMNFLRKRKQSKYLKQLIATINVGDGNPEGIESVKTRNFKKGETDERRSKKNWCPFSTRDRMCKNCGKCTCGDCDACNKVCSCVLGISSCVDVIAGPFAPSAPRPSDVLKLAVILNRMGDWTGVDPECVDMLVNLQRGNCLNTPDVTVKGSVFMKPQDCREKRKISAKVSMGNIKKCKNGLKMQKKPSYPFPPPIVENYDTLPRDEDLKRGLKNLEMDLSKCGISSPNINEKRYNVEMKSMLDGQKRKNMEIFRERAAPEKRLYDQNRINAGFLMRTKTVKQKICELCGSRCVPLKHKSRRVCRMCVKRCAEWCQYESGKRTCSMCGGCSCAECGLVGNICVCIDKSYEGNYSEYKTTRVKKREIEKNMREWKRRCLEKLEKDLDRRKAEIEARKEEEFKRIKFGFLEEARKWEKLTVRRLNEIIKICDPGIFDEKKYREEFRRKFAGMFSWNFPDKEMYVDICDFADEEEILSVGSGSGFNERCLDLYGAEVKATDAFRGFGYERKRSWIEVEKCTGVEAVRKYENNVLLLSWPPYGDPMAYRTLSEFKGSKLVYIGEEELGCTCDDRFFGLLEGWELKKEIHPLRWKNMHDSCFLYVRKGKKDPVRGLSRESAGREIKRQIEKAANSGVEFEIAVFIVVTVLPLGLTQLGAECKREYLIGLRKGIGERKSSKLEENPLAPDLPGGRMERPERKLMHEIWVEVAKYEKRSDVTTDEVRMCENLYSLFVQTGLRELEEEVGREKGYFSMVETFKPKKIYELGMLEVDGAGKTGKYLPIVIEIELSENEEFPCSKELLLKCEKLRTKEAFRGGKIPDEEAHRNFDFITRENLEKWNRMTENPRRIVTILLEKLSDDVI
jgi:8-oxo-dGTP pyrophosphatase MutT (NUDIX family)